MDQDFLESVYHNSKDSNRKRLKKIFKQKDKNYNEVCRVKVSNDTYVFLNLNKNKNWERKKNLISKIRSNSEYGKETKFKKEHVIKIYKDDSSIEESVYKFTNESSKKIKQHQKNQKTRPKASKILCEDFVVSGLKSQKKTYKYYQTSKNNFLIVNLKKFINSVGINGDFILTTFEDPVCTIIPLQSCEKKNISFHKVFVNNECEICLKKSEFKYILTECQHGCCQDCWMNYVITNFPIRELKCCFLDCGQVLELDFLKMILPNDKFNRYEKIYDVKKMEQTFIECKNYCGNFFDKNSGFKIPKCVCGYSICLKCESESHFPLTCKQYLFYLINFNESDKNKHSAIHGKFCPKCKSFIEKNGGCPHMRCFCGFEFCWNCYESYNSIENHICNKSMIADFRLYLNEYIDKSSKDLIQLYSFKALLNTDLNSLVDLKDSFIQKFFDSQFFKDLKPDIMVSMNISDENCHKFINQILDFSYDILKKVFKITELIYAGTIYNKVNKLKINNKQKTFQSKMFTLLRILCKIYKNNCYVDFFSKIIYLIPKVVHLLNILKNS